MRGPQKLYYYNLRKVNIAGKHISFSLLEKPDNGTYEPSSSTS